MKVSQKPAVTSAEVKETPKSATESPAHLAFRQIVVHEFSVDSDPQPVRFNFHYREHSKHLARRGGPDQR